MIANTVFTRQLKLLHLEITRANIKRFPKHKFSDVGIRKQNKREKPRNDTLLSS